MKKRLISLILAAVLCLASAVPALADYPFTDVPEDAWYRDDVLMAFGTGLLKGTTDTTFSPDGTLTMAEAVTLAARLHQYIHTGYVTLEPADGAEWYEPYVLYAGENGLLSREYCSVIQWTVNGRRYDEYILRDPAGIASRARMVELFYRSAEPENYGAVNRVEEYAIPDVLEGSDTAPEVYAFYRAGILTGDGDNRFNGDDSVRRSEAAAILARILDPARRKSVTLVRTAPQLPDYYAPVTEENILAVLETFDPDGAYIVRQSIAMGSTPLDWYGGGENVTDSLNSAVHEECHAFTDYDSEYDFFTEKWTVYYRFYIGDGSSLIVAATDVFDSAELDAVIPEDLKSTSRYDTYVSPSAAANMASRKLGVYGLMNEFTAYCWGANDSLLTYDYRAAHGARGGSNEYISYAEFLYYILTYMLYARDRYPDVYNGIMANTDFLKAFTVVEAKFADVAAQQIEKYRASGNLYWKSDYDALTAQIGTPEYQEMLAQMRAGA